MASRKLIVELVGDSRSLDRTLKQSSRNAQTFSSQMDKTAKSVSGLSRGLVGGFAGAAAFSVVIASLKEVIGLAAESQQILGQTSVAVESSGFSWERYGKNIQSVIAAQSKLGFDDEELLQGMSVFIRTSDTVAEAQRRTNLAMDIARARFIDYGSAVNIVTKASLGNAGALRRLGIDAKLGSTGVQLLTQLEREYGGAAKAAGDDAATAMDRFKVSTENAKEAIGTQLLPMMSTLLDSATAVSDAVTDIGGAVESLNGLVASIGIDLHVNLKGAGAAALFGLVPGSKQLADAIGALRQRSEEKAAPARERARLEGVRDRPLPGEVRPPPATPKPPSTATIEQRNKWWDAMINRAEFRAGAVKTVSGQVAALKKVAGQIQARIRATKDVTRRLRLEDELIRVQMQISGLLTGGGGGGKGGKGGGAGGKTVAELLADAQFAALGFGPGGADPVPGLPALRNVFDRIGKAMKNATPKLIKQTKSLMAGIARILSGGMGDVSEDVRRKIQQLLADLDKKLKGGGGATRRQHFRKANIDATLAGLGLTPEQIRILRGRMAGSTGGKAPLGGQAAFGQRVGAGATVININGDVVTPDSAKFLRDMQKRAAKTRSQQRGVRPGANLGIA